MFLCLILYRETYQFYNHATCDNVGNAQHHYDEHHTRNEMPLFHQRFLRWHDWHVESNGINARYIEHFLEQPAFVEDFLGLIFGVFNHGDNGHWDESCGRCGIDLG